MSEALNFKPEYYKITQLVEPNVIEVEETWFIKLKGVSDSNPDDEIKKWLKENNTVRIIPYRRSKDARIISDVWLGNTHINKQFLNYKRDNLIQAFEYWKNSNEEGFSPAEDDLIEAFQEANSLLSSKLRQSFENWKKIHYLQEKTDSHEGAGEKREKLKNQMIEDFNKWRKMYHG